MCSRGYDRISKNKIKKGKFYLKNKIMCSRGYVRISKNKIKNITI